jgi:hypothetical protein
MWEFANQILQTLADVVRVIGQFNLVSKIYMEIDQLTNFTDSLYTDQRFMVKIFKDIVGRTIVDKINSFDNAHVTATASKELENSLDTFLKRRFDPESKSCIKYTSVACEFKNWYDDVSGHYAVFKSFEPTTIIEHVPTIIIITPDDYSDINKLNLVVEDKQQIYKWAYKRMGDAPYKAAVLRISKNSYTISIDVVNMEWDENSEYNKNASEYYKRMLSGELKDHQGQWGVFDGKKIQFFETYPGRRFGDDAFIHNIGEELNEYR